MAQSVFIFFFLLSFLPEARRDARLYFCELSQIPVEPCQVCLVHARHIFRNLVARLPRCTCGTLRLRGGDHRIICHAQWVHVLMGAAIAADHTCYIEDGDSPSSLKILWFGTLRYERDWSGRKRKNIIVAVFIIILLRDNMMFGFCNKILQNVGDINNFMKRKEKQ